MTLADLPLPITAADGRQYALVFSASLAGRLGELWRQHGSRNLVPQPSRLVDGRWWLSGDILSEIGPGGLLHAMWEAADKATLLPAVEVVPIADAMALMPQPQEA